MICAIGAYTVNNKMFDVWMMLVFGVIGYVFKSSTIRSRRWCWRIVLGDQAEEAFRQAMLQPRSLGDLLVELAGRLDHDTRPAAAVLAVLDRLGISELRWPTQSTSRTWTRAPDQASNQKARRKITPKQYN